MRLSAFSIMLMCIFYAPWSFGQSAATTDIAVFGAYADRCARIEQDLNAYTSKQLKKIERLAQRLQSGQGTARTDTASQPGYAERLRNPVASNLAALADGKDRALHYIGFLDSFQTALKLHAINPGAVQHIERLGQLLEKSGHVQQAFNESAMIEGRLVGYLQTLAGQLPTARAMRQLRELQNAVGAYQLKIRYYKQALTNPDRALREVFTILKKTRVFQQFFRRYSALAALLPPDPAEAVLLEPGTFGLQTRELVRQAMYDRAGQSVNTAAFASQSATEWKSQLQQLKNKLENAKSRPLPEDVQGNPNPEKTKSFLKRLQFGTNVQSTRGNGLLPATTDLGISVGLKLNAQSVVGIGGSYKVGWGESIRKIRLSHQGASLRSFIDWKIKGSFYCSGGYEYNYQPVTTETPPTIRFSSWKNSGLIGVSKTIAANHKFFKQAKMQVLWDALARQQMPRSPAFKFRIGYNLN
ncbi:hypothetical protein [Chitinophaga barathri]|uniref:Uncharacterized protein n=1 Tax=Chitinophaga barathri TaxID=1647451 RepID=A0A3N4MHP6_9BACT|nr:hypothetical protein [Chitinophaga barathri]RPD43128.1 hypothetical protein EG028_02200 [Chitinophaga barathri]